MGTAKPLGAANANTRAPRIEGWVGLKIRITLLPVYSRRNRPSPTNTQATSYSLACDRFVNGTGAESNRMKFFWQWENQENEKY
jgi:hypothetical protein